MDLLTDSTKEDLEVKVPSVLLDLIPQYLENRRNELRVLNDAYQKHDFQTIENIGHKLKGNAGSYGFEYLTEIGMSLENAARSHEPKDISSLIHSYGEYLDKVKVVPA